MRLCVAIQYIIKIPKTIAPKNGYYLLRGFLKREKMYEYLRKGLEGLGCVFLNPERAWEHGTLPNPF